MFLALACLLHIVNYCIAAALQLQMEADGVSSGSMSMDRPKVPSVRWEDIGGLADAKREILDLVRLLDAYVHTHIHLLRIRTLRRLHNPHGCITCAVLLTS